MSAAGLKKVADVAQKGMALSCVGMFMYHIGQISYQVSGGVTETPKAVDPTYFESVKEKIEEDRKKRESIEHRDWYDEDDDSYLKNLPRGKKPKN